MSQTIQKTRLPMVGETSDLGTFAGLITTAIGTHCAVMLLPQIWPGVTWRGAQATAEKLGAQLPSRLICSLIQQNVPDFIKRDQRIANYACWTHELTPDGAPWVHHFRQGRQTPRKPGARSDAIFVNLIQLPHES